VKEQIFHGVAADEKECALKSIEAGVDIEMMTSCYPKHLKELVESGDVSEETINESVLRILTLKEKLGLFENPYRGASEELEAEVILSEDHRKVSRELATKSCVLLKNENVLPLQKEQKIALIGPFASSGDIMGAWSWHGRQEDAVQLQEAFKTKMDSSNLTIAQGSDIETITEEQIQEAVKAAEGADVIVLAVGERADMSGEAKCRADIRLPQAQLELIDRMKELQKPIVTVLFNGRPLDLHGVIDRVDALLEAWYPGTEGGAAVADLLFGDANPSGKLTMSFPYSVGQVPVYYNHFNTGRPNRPDAPDHYVSKYLDIPNEPLLPFGYGLSYTSFTYSDMSLSNEAVTPNEPITASIQVTNSGPMPGEEIVQLYVRDIAGEIVRPLKELKGYQKVWLEPGETKEVSFTISEEALRYYHANLEFISDNGEFHAMIGPNSTELTIRSFRLEK
jgi:beta-glucosidase